MAETQAGRVDFFGPPHNVRMVSSDFDQMADARDVSCPQWQDRGASAPTLRRSRDPSQMRLRLDPKTPPGEYTATLHLGNGNPREIRVAVEPRERLRFTPGGLRLVGRPGEEVSTRLLVENIGNVEVDIPDKLVTGTFDDDGIETAFASTYRMKTDDLNKIVGNLFSRLRQSHGGLLGLRVVEGSGRLLRGERRIVALSTTLNSKLRRGHSYHGVLDIGERSISVRIDVEDAKSASTGA